jgi:hypothetical protein
VRNEPEAAIEAVERARRLSPFDPYTFRWGPYYWVRSSRRAALRTGDRMGRPRLARPVAHGLSNADKVAANAHLVRLDEARGELSRVLATDPKLSIAGFRAYAQFYAPEVLELYVTGLRLAGLSEK